MSKANESYLVSKSFSSFLVATVLTSIIAQVNIMVDGVIVGNLISPDAVSALNLVVPISNFIVGIDALFCMGAGILAAKALGGQDYKQANAIFTVSILSVFIVVSVISICCMFFVSDIANMLCSDGKLIGYLISYLRVMLPGFILSTLVFGFNIFVSVDGKPILITRSVIGNALGNLVCDLIFIKVFGWGLSGAALASIVGFLIGLTILVFYMASKNFSFRFIRSFRNSAGILKTITKQGTPFLLGTWIMSILFFSINSIIISVQGMQGIFIMSVCLQLLMFSFIGFTGASQAVTSIGSVMIGENDMKGLRILLKNCMKFLLVVLGVLTVYVLIAPQTVVQLFGCKSPDWISASILPIRIFILCVIPLGVIMVIKSLYQILGHLNASIIFGVLPTFILIPMMWGLAVLYPDHLWWSFPVSYLLVMVILWLYSETVRKKHPDYQRFTLIPADDKRYSMRQTIMYTNDDVDRVLKEIRKFLIDSQINDTLVNHAVICCEELMYNIVQHATNEPDKHFFDVHALVHDDKLTIIIKDDGKQFNPKFPYVEPTEEQLFGGADLKLGLTLVNGLCEDMNYKYMYGQNMLYLNFKR